MVESRFVVDTDQLDWIERSTPGGQVLGTKVLRINDDFTYVDLLRVPAGVTSPAHVHVGEIEVFILAGEMETVAGVAREDSWILEPAGAIHKASDSFAGERTLSEVVALNHVLGPIAFVQPDGSVKPIVFGQALKASVDAMKRKAEGGDPGQPAPPVYRDDCPYGGLDTAALDWAPSGYDGVSIKVLRVADSGRFSVMVKGEDGSEIPSRRYLAPADFYVRTGCLRFSDAEATADHWVYGPAGFNEGPARHIGETTYLATFAGPAVDLGRDGGFDRMFDASSVRNSEVKITA